MVRGVSGSGGRRAGAQGFPRSRRGSGSGRLKGIRNPWAERRERKPRRREKKPASFVSFERDPREPGLDVRKAEEAA